MLPIATNRCTVHFDWWFDTGCDDDFIRDSMAQSGRSSRRTSRSVSACNGMESGVFDRGRYAPRIETAMQHFHRLSSRDLRRALE